MKNKLSARFTAVLIIFSLMGQIAWVVENMYFNVFIYKMFSASALDISLMVAASAVIATITTVFMGALSDKLGKRKIFICAGYMLWGISILSFMFIKEDIINKFIPATFSAASVCVSLTIILDCIMTFFGSTANDAAFNALVTDSTNTSNRGKAEGINSMMPLVAILAVFGGFMAFDLNKQTSWDFIFIIIGVLTFLIGVLGFFLIKEPSITPTKESYLKTIFYGFKKSTIKENIFLYKSLALFIIFNIAIQIFMPYLIIYYEVSLNLKNYVLIMAPAIIVASFITVIWGRVYDNKGFKFSSITAVGALLLGFLILAVFKNTILVFIGSLLMMCGYLSGMAVFGAKIRDLTPKGKAGRLQGIRIFSQVLIPGIIGPFIGKTVLLNAKTIINNDGTTSFVPNENIFYAAFIVALILLFLLLVIKDKEEKFETLTTPFENDDKIPFSSYPRPQFKRDSYLCLNGEWDFYVNNKKGTKSLGKILVPFPPESKASGIYKNLSENDLRIYKRSFIIDESFKKDRVFLNFGASDFKTTVFINGKWVGENEGGYLPFSFDISNAVKIGENTIEVRVIDTQNTDFPFGKQRKKRGGMWYTAVSGIWQTVWLESTAKNYIKDLKIKTTLNSVTFNLKGGSKEKTLEIELNGEKKKINFTGNSYTLKIENPKLWTPENPNIYTFSIKTLEDKIESYFALRTISIIKKGNKKVLALNNKPYFFNGLLDQGYFSDGIYTPFSEEGYKNDILTMKKLGFNTLRKHIKIEPLLFYYYCDIYGMAVFQDMVNSGKYNFLIDTALPTIGFKKGIRHKANKTRKEHFEKAAKNTLKLLHNSPSVVLYTIFNEGWGQYEEGRIYDELKKEDNTRIYDSASGWFYPKKSDVYSIHTYFKPIKISEKLSDKPIILSEFGGYSCKIKNHSFNLEKTYGYGKFSTKEEFEKALVKLYENEILPAVDNGLCATVLTQVSDVEDETNGLFTYDRQILKIKENALKNIFLKIEERFKA